MDQCDKCLNSEIAYWEVDEITSKRVPIYWCKKKGRMCDDIENCLVFDSGEDDERTTESKEV